MDEWIIGSAKRAVADLFDDTMNAKSSSKYTQYNIKVVARVGAAQFSGGCFWTHRYVNQVGYGYHKILMTSVN